MDGHSISKRSTASLSPAAATLGQQVHTIIDFLFLKHNERVIPYLRSKTCLRVSLKPYFHVSIRFAYRCLFQEYLINFVREEEKGKRSRERKSVKMRDRKSAKASSSLGDTEQPMRQKRTRCSVWNILLAARYPLKSGNDVSVYL
jgi:hypothetical protein